MESSSYQKTLHAWLNILILFISETKQRGIVYPTIVWDPRNPLFACEDPLIKVQYNDEINFMCPDKQWHSYILPENSKPQYFENMYFVENENMFKSCNATISRKILSCTDQKIKNFYRMPFAVTSSDSLPFNQGETLHFIATSFRTLESSTNLVGGSCNYTNDLDEFKMRLKLYICSDEDVEKGNCELCKTDTCYYSSCDSKCSEWERSGEIITKEGMCMMQENRTCTNALLKQQNKETRLLEIQCPAAQCTDWVSLEYEKYQAQESACFIGQNRTCLKGSEKYIENRITDVQCPNDICSPWSSDFKVVYFTTAECEMQQTRTCLKPWSKITTTEIQKINISCPYIINNVSAYAFLKTGKSTSRERQTPQILYIVGGTAALLFIIGFLLGAGTFKCIHKKKCLNHKKDATKEVTGYNNQTFTPDTLEGANKLPEMYTGTQPNTEKHWNSFINFKKYANYNRNHDQSNSTLNETTVTKDRPATGRINFIYQTNSSDVEDSNEKRIFNRNLIKQASDLNNLVAEKEKSEKFESTKQSPAQQKPPCVLVEEF